MFTEFFYSLKSAGVPVTSGELLDLLHALKEITSENGSMDPEEFYTVARNCLIKDIRYYDDYDLVFAGVFGNTLQEKSEFKKRLQEWLKQAVENRLSEERKKNALQIPYEKLLEELEKRFREQKERHDRGNHWIGTGGTSPFGNSGYNPSGIRIGGQSSGRSAISVAGDRRYEEYRTDRQLDVRQMKVALKKLKILRKEGRKEISIEKTIQETCKNAGEIEVVEERSRKNNLCLLLFLDVGGSMSPHSVQVSRLFSALHQMNHFKEYRFYYFHNIIYNYVYKDALFRQKIPVREILHKWNSSTRVIFVGDAYMAPYELLQKNQYMDDAYSFLYSRDALKKRGAKEENLSGLERLKLMKSQFPRSIWLNPEDKRFWNESTIQTIRTVVPMHYLSVNGLESGIRELING